MLTIYYRNGCPFCEEALRLLIKNKIKFRKYNVNDYGGKDLVFNFLKKQKVLRKNSTHDTLPLIFGFAGEYIGGCTELKRFL